MPVRRSRWRYPRGFSYAVSALTGRALNKRSRTHLCVDFAWGKNGAKGVYLAIQDAFESVNPEPRSQPLMGALIV
jgi:hypothetical protein